MKKIFAICILFFLMAAIVPAARVLAGESGPAENTAGMVTPDVPRTDTEGTSGQRPEAGAVREGQLAEAAGMAFYVASSEDESVWPFLAGEADGKACIYASNSGREASAAEVRVIAKAARGQVFAFQLKYSTREDRDFVILSRNGESLWKRSGFSGWQECAVALEEGSNEISIRYVKDQPYADQPAGQHAGTDTGLSAGKEAEQPAESDYVCLADFALLSGEEARAFLDAVEETSDHSGSGSAAGGETPELVVAVYDEYVLDPNKENADAANGPLIIYEDSGDYENDAKGEDSGGDEIEYEVLDEDEYEYENEDEYEDENEGSGSGDLIVDNEDLDMLEYIWTAYFTDQNGEPVPGCIVNFCTENTCMPVSSDEDGNAVFYGEPYPYHIQVVRVPEGYEFDTSQEFTAAEYGDDLTFEIIKN